MIEYIGLPYDIHNKNGLNCWALVAKVYKDRFGASIADYPSPSNNIRDIAATFTAAFANGEHGFTQQASPKDYDVVIFKKMTRFNFIFHCGIWIDGRVLHSSSRSGGVVYEPLKIAGHGFKEIEFWRR
jgi:cell wall-associated NlpC family hydrolase